MNWRNLPDLGSLRSIRGTTMQFQQGTIHEVPLLARKAYDIAFPARGPRYSVDVAQTGEKHVGTLTPLPEMAELLEIAKTPEMEDANAAAVGVHWIALTTLSRYMRDNMPECGGPLDALLSLFMDPHKSARARTLAFPELPFQSEIEVDSVSKAIRRASTHDVIIAEPAALVKLVQSHLPKLQSRGCVLQDGGMYWEADVYLQASAQSPLSIPLETMRSATIELALARAQLIFVQKAFDHFMLLQPHIGGDSLFRQKLAKHFVSSVSSVYDNQPASAEAGSSELARLYSQHMNNAMATALPCRTKSDKAEQWNRLERRANDAHLSGNVAALRAVVAEEDAFVKSC